MSVDQELIDVKKTVISWKHRQNQRYKVLQYLVENGNKWIEPNVLRASLPEIKGPNTVLYDMALRNPNNTPRGRGYYDRMRVYPPGYSANPILEYKDNLGYRIRPEYCETISRTV